MSYQMKDMSGSIFKNDKKQSDKHPDRSGSAMIDGTEYWISGWIRQDKNGQPWMSLAFKRKDEKPAAKPRQSTREEFSDEIPF